MRFTSNHSAKALIANIEDIGTEMGFRVQKKNAKVSIISVLRVYGKAQIRFNMFLNIMPQCFS